MSTALRIGVVTVLGLAAAGGAHAQTAAPVGSLEEVIVTTQKREQRVQDVPVSVSAFGPEFLAEQNVQDFGELARFTPGFVSTPNYSYLIYSSIRGINTSDFGFGADPSIGFYVNGVHTGRYGTQVASFYDLDRVEVVKGPQNTLFGRSSIAGAISVTTQRPTDAFEGSVQAGFGNLQRREFTGVVNVPLAEGWALRAAGYSLDQDGYLRNTFGGEDIGASDIKSGRLSLRWSSLDWLDANLVLSYEQRDETGNVYEADGLPEFTVSSTLRGDENHSDFEVKDATLDLAFRLTDRASIRSLTNVRKVKADYAEDYDAVAQVAGGPYYQGQDVDLFNQEVRFEYTAPKGLSLVAGASYFDEDMDAFVGEWVDTGLAFTGAADLATLQPGSYANAFIERGDYETGARGYAVYLDASYPVVDRLTLTAGIRRVRDEKEMTLAIPDPAVLPENANAPFPCACYLYGAWLSQPLSFDRTWNATVGRFAATYALTPDVSAYASWSQGWKAGGIESFKFELPPGFPLYFGLDLAAAGGTLRAYDPEKSNSYEVGVKGVTPGRTLRYGLTAFSYRYRDLQNNVFAGATSVIQNIGKAKGQGFEAELQAKPTESWDLFANAGYTDTEITEDPRTGQKGLPLNRAPKWTAAAGARYRIPVGPGSIVLGASYSYQDRYRTDNQLSLAVDSTSIVNADVVFESTDGRYRVRVFGDNLTDEFTFGRRLEPQAFLFPVASRSLIGKPRQYGVELRYAFGR